MHVVVREYRRSFLWRMWNSSEFMRTYKQHFTMSFNARRDHHGTMFEGRYHERNHKPEKPVMWRTAAYVDINAWSAGIVKKAEDGPMRPSALRKAVGIRSSIHSIAITFPRCWRGASLLEPIPIIRSRPSRGIA